MCLREPNRTTSVQNLVHTQISKGERQRQERAAKRWQYQVARAPLAAECCREIIAMARENRRDRKVSRSDRARKRGLSRCRPRGQGRAGACGGGARGRLAQISQLNMAADFGAEWICGVFDYITRKSLLGVCIDITRLRVGCGSRSGCSTVEVGRETLTQGSRAICAQ